MRTIAVESDTLATGWTIVTARIPPRVCGAPNTGATQRAREVLGAIEPDAFDPMPEAVAAAVQRDIPPPNCDGCIAEARTPRASFPPFVVDDRDDDEGSLAEPARYPPGVACNVTGGCE